MRRRRTIARVQAKARLAELTSVERKATAEICGALDKASPAETAAFLALEETPESIAFLLILIDAYVAGQAEAIATLDGLRPLAEAVQNSHAGMAGRTEAVEAFKRALAKVRTEAD